MTQTRLESLIESGVNIAIGYLVALASQIAIFPLFGLQVPFGDNLLIGLWFTVISLVRSYIIRRWFNKRLHTQARRLAREARELLESIGYEEEK